ncbi:MAG: dynamin family protein [Lachnospiraceae bacterium]|nr:dynamin family protein [Lachnospiraceae bacterium]
MELNNRIHYDVAELMGRIETSLDRLKPYQYDSKYRELLGELLVGKINAWEQNIRKRKNDPFTLVICGDFKRGKSSLINALLGEDVVPTNVTTETVTLNRISYGAHSNEAILSGGRRLSLTDEELCRDALEPVIKQLNEPVEQLELHRNIDILKDITIIDTPGLGDSERDFTDAVDSALQQADAVIYVFSVAYPLSRGEQLYLKTSIIPQRYTSLFLVSNFTDMITDENDYVRMQDMLTDRVNGLLPGQDIWMLSALDERCRQLEEERPNLKLADTMSTSFQEFRNAITELIQNKKETVLPDRMQRMLRIMAADINDDLAALEQGIEMNSQDVQQAMDNVKQQKEQQAQTQEENSRKIDDLIRVMQGEAIGWINELLERMKAETASLEIYSKEDLSKYYPFFCIDTMQEALTRCVDYHMVNLYDELNTISDELTQSMSKNHIQSQYSFRFVLDNKTWTKGDNVGFAVSMIGSGGLLTIIADGIGGAMRKKELEKHKPQIVQEIQRQYDSLFVSVQKTTADTYRKMGNQAKQHLKEFYSTKLQTLEQQMEQSAAVARQDETKKAEIREAANQLRSVLSDIVQLI